MSNTPTTQVETRAQHLEWCKKRALVYADAGDLAQAIASMASDLNKHPETDNHGAIGLMFQMHMAGFLASLAKMRKFIEGFN